MALTLNGKKKRLKKQDFTTAMSALNVEEKQQQNIFNKMEKALPEWLELIDKSFLSADFKARYKAIILERQGRMT
jgi:serine/threonine-protein kinase HipA